MSLLAGLTRTASRAVGGITLDISSGLARAGEAARAALAGETIGPASTARAASAALASPLDTSRARPPIARDPVRVSPASRLMPTLRSFLADH